LTTASLSSSLRKKQHTNLKYEDLKATTHTHDLITHAAKFGRDESRKRQDYIDEKLALVITELSD